MPLTRDMRVNGLSLLVEGGRRNGRHDDWAGKPADETLEASHTEPDGAAEKLGRGRGRKGARPPPFGGAVPDDAADAALCGARGEDTRAHGTRECRVLLAAWVAERDAPAQKPIVQLAALARRLGRTLVLPNVHRGALGTCLARGLDLYYDIAGGAMVRDRDAGPSTPRAAGVCRG